MTQTRSAPLFSPNAQDDPVQNAQTQVSAFRKCLIVFTASWVTLAATFSSTSLFSISSEIATSLNTTTESVNLVNAASLFVMGLSTFVYYPVEVLTGRFLAYLSCIVLLMALTVGTALAPTFVGFAVLRILTGIQGTYFHVSGQSMIAEHFPPTQRGFATGFFLFGTVLGPPLGPCIAGLITAHSDWRNVLWLQVAMAGLGLLLSIAVVPRTTRTLKLFLELDVLLPDLACGLLSWAQYSLISGPRVILAKNFGLTDPIAATVFYIPLLFGFLFGSIVGGKLSDIGVARWVSLRDGTRIPSDRLHGAVWVFVGILPVSFSIYGWTLEYCAAGLAVPMIFGFFCAAGLLIAFAGINTYCAEARPKSRVQAIASKYLVQYAFGGLASGSSVPLIKSIGTGPSCMIVIACTSVAGSLVYLTARYAPQWACARNGPNKDVVLYMHEDCAQVSSAMPDIEGKP